MPRPKVERPLRVETPRAEPERAEPERADPVRAEPDRTDRLWMPEVVVPLLDLWLALVLPKRLAERSRRRVVELPPVEDRVEDLVEVRLRRRALSPREDDLVPSRRVRVLDLVPRLERVDVADAPDRPWVQERSRLEAPAFRLPEVERTLDRVRLVPRSPIWAERVERAAVEDPDVVR